METRTLIPLPQWYDYHDYPPIDKLTNYILNRKDNGLDQFRVVKKLGKLTLIDEAAFFEWIEKTSK